MAEETSESAPANEGPKKSKSAKKTKKKATSKAESKPTKAPEESGREEQDTVQDIPAIPDPEKSSERAAKAAEPADVVTTDAFQNVKEALASAESTGQGLLPGLDD